MNSINMINIQETSHKCTDYPRHRPKRNIRIPNIHRTQISGTFPSHPHSHRRPNTNPPFQEQVRAGEERVFVHFIAARFKKDIKIVWDDIVAFLKNTYKKDIATNLKYLEKRGVDPLDDVMGTGVKVATGIGRSKEMLGSK